MLVIQLPTLPQLIAGTTVVLLLVATALALCCCRNQTGRSASTSTSTDDGNNNSSTNINNNLTNDDGLSDGSQGRRWYFCCCFGKKRTHTRDFATLNDLLLEVDENETGWLNVVATPRSTATAERSSRLEVSVDSFFPDILSEPARKGGRGRSASTGGSREDLHETLL
jgi:hypothetical protein